METTAREFTRNFPKLRAVAARGKVVRVTAPEGVYLSIWERSAKICGAFLDGLGAYSGRGFLTEAGAAALEAANRRPANDRSPWDAAP